MADGQGFGERPHCSRRTLPFHLTFTQGVCSGLEFKSGLEILLNFLKQLKSLWIVYEMWRRPWEDWNLSRAHQTSGGSRLKVASSRVWIPKYFPFIEVRELLHFKNCYWLSGRGFVCEFTFLRLLAIVLSSAKCSLDKLPSMPFDEARWQFFQTILCRWCGPVAGKPRKLNLHTKKEDVWEGGWPDFLTKKSRGHQYALRSSVLALLLLIWYGVCWHCDCRRDLPFAACAHLTNPWNEGKPVKVGRDGQVQ